MIRCLVKNTTTALPMLLPSKERLTILTLERLALGKSSCFKRKEKDEK
jgi:hypothetical protein